MSKNKIAKKPLRLKNLYKFKSINMFKLEIKSQKTDYYVYLFISCDKMIQLLCILYMISQNIFKASFTNILVIFISILVIVYLIQLILSKFEDTSLTLVTEFYTFVYYFVSSFQIIFCWFLNMCCSIHIYNCIIFDYAIMRKTISERWYLFVSFILVLAIILILSIEFFVKLQLHDFFRCKLFKESQELLNIVIFFYSVYCFCIYVCFFI